MSNPYTAGGLPVTAPIVPTSPDDSYPTHIANFGLGGYVAVANSAERDALPVARRAPGMAVCCRHNGAVYRLAEDLVTWSEQLPPEEPEVIEVGADADGDPVPLDMSGATEKSMRVIWTALAKDIRLANVGQRCRCTLYVSNRLAAETTFAFNRPTGVEIVNAVDGSAGNYTSHSVKPGETAVFVVEVYHGRIIYVTRVASTYKYPAPAFAPRALAYYACHSIANDTSRNAAGGTALTVPAGAWTTVAGKNGKALKQLTWNADHSPLAKVTQANLNLTPRAGQTEWTFRCLYKLANATTFPARIAAICDPAAPSLGDLVITAMSDRVRVTVGGVDTDHTLTPSAVNWVYLLITHHGGSTQTVVKASYTYTLPVGQTRLGARTFAGHTCLTLGDSTANQVPNLSVDEVALWPYKLAADEQTTDAASVMDNKYHFSGTDFAPVKTAQLTATAIAAGAIASPIVNGVVLSLGDRVMRCNTEANSYYSANAGIYEVALGSALTTTTYDANGQCAVTVTPGAIYVWTQGNAQFVSNGYAQVSADTLFTAAGEAVVLYGTPGEAVTATIRPAVWALAYDSSHVEDYPFGRRVEVLHGREGIGLWAYGGSPAENEFDTLASEYRFFEPVSLETV